MDEGRKDKVEGQSSVPVTSKWYRIYINNFKDPDNLWAVDEGTTETQRTCLKVIFGGTGTHPGSTDFDLKADNIREPKAWVTTYGALSEHHDKLGRKIFLIIRK